MPAVPEKPTSSKTQTPSLQRRDAISEGKQLKKAFTESLADNKQLTRLDKNIDDLFRLWVSTNKQSSTNNNADLISSIDILQKSVSSATTAFKTKPDLSSDDIKELTASISILIKKLESIDSDKSKDIINNTLSDKLEAIIDIINKKSDSINVDVNLPEDNTEKITKALAKQESELFKKWLETQKKTTDKAKELPNKKDITFKGNMSNILFGTESSWLGNKFNKKFGITNKEKGLSEEQPTDTTTIKGHISNTILGKDNSIISDNINKKTGVTDKDRGINDNTESVSSDNTNINSTLATDIPKLLSNSSELNQLIEASNENEIEEYKISEQKAEPSISNSDKDLQASIANDAADAQAEKMDEFNKATLAKYDSQIGLLTEIRDILKEQSSDFKNTKKQSSNGSSNNDNSDDDDDGFNLDIDIDRDDKRKRKRKRGRGKRGRGSSLKKGSRLGRIARGAASIGRGAIGVLGTDVATMGAGALLGTAALAAGVGVAAYEGTSYLMENTETGKKITKGLENAMYSSKPGDDEARMGVMQGAISDPIGWGSWQIADKDKLLKDFNSKEIADMAKSDKFDDETKKELLSLSKQSAEIEEAKKAARLAKAKPEDAKPVSTTSTTDVKLNNDTAKLSEPSTSSNTQPIDNKTIDTLKVAPTVVDDSISKMKSDIQTEKVNTTEKLNDTMSNIHKSLDKPKSDTHINNNDSIKESFTKLEALIKELISAVNNSKTVSSTEIEIPLLKEKRASL